MSPARGSHRARLRPARLVSFSPGLDGVRHLALLVERQRAGAALGELVERQVDHVARALGVDQHLVGVAEHHFQGLEVQALARDAGRSQVARQQLGEALRFTLGVGDDARLVGRCILRLARGRTLGFRQDVVGVGLRLQGEALAVFARLDGVALRTLHLLRHADALQVDRRHLDAGLVRIERALDQFLGLGRDFLAALLEHEVELAATDDLADGAFGDFLQRLFGIAHVERVRHRLGTPVLHGDVDVDEVFVRR